LAVGAQPGGEGQVIGPVVKYPGSKWRLARWIVTHMPPHTAYCEPFAGSLAVLFAKPRAKLETINDLDGAVVNLWRVVRERPEALARALALTPYSREEYDLSYAPPTGDPVEDARRFVVRCSQAFGSKLGTRTGWRHVITTEYAPNRPPSAQWLDLPDRVWRAHERLRRVQIERRPALEVVGAHAREEVLIYADPPYVLSTRSGRQYRHEMTDDEHVQFVAALDAHPGPALLSGYANGLYEDLLGRWASVTMRTNDAVGNRREEVLWMNERAAACRQLGLEGLA
jgi:DNA adenine methylase